MVVSLVPTIGDSNPHFRLNDAVVVEFDTWSHEGELEQDHVGINLGCANTANCKSLVAKEAGVCAPNLGLLPNLHSWP